MSKWIDYSEIKKKTRYLVDISKELKDNPSPDKSSGYLTLVFKGFTEMNSLGIGVIPFDKEEKYMKFSEEKAHRVYSHWLRGMWLLDKEETPGITSYQTRNPDKSMWGGAVLFENSGSYFYRPNIVSFSGLPEHIDEAISFIIGKDLGFMKDKGLLDKIKKISNNPFIDEMIYRFENRIK